MNIGVVPDPLNWERWEEAKALLEPARKLGGFEEVIDPDELLWAVMDGDELLAVATAWLSKRGYVEVKLIGGHDHRRWLGELANRIGAAAMEAGATRVIGIGRRAWGREILRHGWVKLSEDDDRMAVFALELGGHSAVGV